MQFSRTIQSPNRTGSLGTVNVQIEPQGTTHYEVYRELDLHWDKAIFLAGRQRKVTLNVDAFNLLNAATILAQQTRQDQSQASYISTILAPRVARFGVKVNF